MGRSLLIGMLLLGLFAAMMSNVASRLTPVRAEHRMVAAAAEDTPVQPVEASLVSSPNDGSGVAIQRSRDGHFYADVEINGSPVHMLIDTGATVVALSRDDARSAGIATSIGMNDVVGEGADGSVRGEYVTIDRISLGGTSVNGLNAVVLNSGERSLLGQQFLAKFDSVEIHGDTMVLK